MQLEHQVTNKEISQRLKELGVKQESLFYWRRLFEYSEIEDSEPVLREEYEICNDDGEFCFHDLRTQISAFTVAELGEFLKKADWGELPFYLGQDKWMWEVRENCEDHAAGQADTEADARGAMLVYLLENKLITL